MRLKGASLAGAYTIQPASLGYAAFGSGLAGILNDAATWSITSTSDWVYSRSAAARSHTRASSR
jgi:hypothetical protein